MARQHLYSIVTTWTGNTGQGTANYSAYARSHEITAPGKPTLIGSSDPAFRGDAACWNPEELLLAALSACHQLWFLHLCADAGIVVTAYVDRATGEMAEEADGSGRFTRVVLHPQVTIAASADHTPDAAKAQHLHAAAHAKCFIASSVNFPVVHEPSMRVTVASG